MPSIDKEDLEKIKLFKDGYKKCKVISSNDAKEAEEYAKQIKYFGYDMRQGLEALEDMVAEKKTDPEVIKGKKIEDYEVYRDIKAMLKDVKYNLKKVVEAAKNLEKSEKNADIETCKKKLNKLLKEIQSDTKDRKGGKPEKIVANLQKQIEEDLKLMDDFHADIKKALPKYPKLPDYAKEYDREVTNIANIKPRLSSRTQKYIKQVAKLVDPKALKKTVAESEGDKQKLTEIATAAKSAAETSDDRNLAKNITLGDFLLKKMNMDRDQYLKIRKKYSIEIGNSVNSKIIEKAVDTLDDNWEKADKDWSDAKIDIDKTKKDQAKKAKKG